MGDDDRTLYDDGGIACDDRGVVIRRYFPWGGEKRVPYTDIRAVEAVPLTGLAKLRRWRIWGSGDFRHWWNLDTRRPRKDLALVLHTGGRVLPTITPDDPTEVRRILAAHGVTS
jgi:hypothetical protein